MRWYWLLPALLLSSLAQAQKMEGLAPTPPMGWNSWNTFGCNIDERLIMDTAQAMVKSGMKDAGYVYVNIDDCWHGERDAQGNIQADPQRFSGGIKALADHIHAMGLKLGIYSDAGWKTCGGRPGSRGYEFQDARTYAAWGIDYLKYDWCNTEGLKAEGAYLTMRDALAATGRPIVFSICEWGDNEPWLWAADIGHLWRTTGDIIDCFDCVISHGNWASSGILPILDKQTELRKYAGPGHWNDPDMMEVGNAMSTNQDRAHFSMWAMLAAPLIAGNDLRSMSRETIAILTNRDVIAINQDPLGVQALKYRDDGDVEFWFKPLQGGDWAMAILNRGRAAARIEFDWSREHVTDDVSGLQTGFKDRRYTIRDLWSGKSAGTTGSAMRTEVPAQDVRVFRLSPGTSTGS